MTDLELLKMIIRKVNDDLGIFPGELMEVVKGLGKRTNEELLEILVQEGWLNCVGIEIAQELINRTGKQKELHAKSGKIRKITDQISD
jgi:hypothetical protein